MDGMKKVSAFSMFYKGKKKGDTPTMERDSSKRTSLKKASSEPTINGDDESKSKKLLRAIKGGSFRNTVRGNKHRPNLANGSGNSPFVAGDGDEVKLTSVKGKAKADEQSNTPMTGTPAISKKSGKSSTPKSGELTKTAKQKKNLPPLPVADFKDTPRSSIQTDGDTSRVRGKRELDDAVPSTSASKKKRVESPKSPKQALVQPVNPQKKEKLNKKRLMPNAVLDTVYDSTEEAKKLFECMIHPVQTDKFFKELWQKKPLLVRRHIKNYNDGWFSTEELDKILENEHIEFGVNLDVTSYRDGKRETHNPPGRAYRSVVWDHYQNGCSVRMLNPQTYSKNVWKMLSTLQEYFNCCVGANVYLTPPGTQGFAPHFDDIEAFILQLEGKKHWKLYNPRTEQETLPRVSSGNFDQSEIGTPILDITLEAGDLLYFPRGTIHQGYALENDHSLHITFSCYQKNTWGDLLEKLLPRALEIAIEEDVEYREGLPLDYLNYTGVVNSDMDHPQRNAFTQKISNLLIKMVQNYCPTDSACDQLGKRFIHDSLPPVFSDMEKSCSVHGHGERWDPVSQTVKGNTEVEPDTMIKLVRKGCIRLVTEEDTVRVYHNIENARVYHGREPQFIEVSADLAPCVEFLIHSYPEYVSVDSLPVGSVEEQVEIASILYDKGLLITGNTPKFPLKVEETELDIREDSGTDVNNGVGDQDAQRLQSNNGNSTQSIEVTQGGKSNSMIPTQQNNFTIPPAYNQTPQFNTGCSDVNSAAPNLTSNSELGAKTLTINEEYSSKNLNNIDSNFCALTKPETVQKTNLGRSENTGNSLMAPQTQLWNSEHYKSNNKSPRSQTLESLFQSQVNFTSGDPNTGLSSDLQRQIEERVERRGVRSPNKAFASPGWSADCLFSGMNKPSEVPNVDSIQVQPFSFPTESDENVNEDLTCALKYCQADMSESYNFNPSFPLDKNYYPSDFRVENSQPQSVALHDEQSYGIGTEQIQNKDEEGMYMYMMKQDHHMKIENDDDDDSEGRLFMDESEAVNPEKNPVMTETEYDQVKQQDFSTLENPAENFWSFPVPMKSKPLGKITVKKEGEEVGTTQFACKKCPFITEYRSVLKLHGQYKHNEEDYPMFECDQCSYTTTDKSDFNSHYAKEHSAKTLKKSIVKEHLKKRRNKSVNSEKKKEKGFKCNICDVVEETEEGLVDHKRIVHEYIEKNYKCEDCAFVSKRFDSLCKHQWYVHGNPEFSCCWKCAKSFNNKKDYKEHKCADIKVRCHLCSKLFSNPKNLQAHLRRHTNYSRHVCDICKKGFPRPAELTYHKQFVHTEKCLQCKYCDITFHYDCSLARHLKKFHSDVLNEDDDDDTFETKEEIESSETKEQVEIVKVKLDFKRNKTKEGLKTSEANELIQTGKTKEAIEA